MSKRSLELLDEVLHCCPCCGSPWPLGMRPPTWQQYDAALSRARLELGPLAEQRAVLVRIGQLLRAA